MTSFDWWWTRPTTLRSFIQLSPVWTSHWPQHPVPSWGRAWARGSLHSPPRRSPAPSWPRCLGSGLGVPLVWGWREDWSHHLQTKVVWFVLYSIVPVNTVFMTWGVKNNPFNLPDSKYYPKLGKLARLPNRQPINKYRCDACTVAGCIGTTNNQWFYLWDYTVKTISPSAKECSIVADGVKGVLLQMSLLYMFKRLPWNFMPQFHPDILPYGLFQITCITYTIAFDTTCPSIREVISNVKQITKK